MMKIVMPLLDEMVTGGTVAKWHKKVGDPVRPDELLFEAETEKVITEISAQGIEMVDTVFQRSASTAGKTCRGNSSLERALHGFKGLFWGRNRPLRAGGKLK